MTPTSGAQTLLDSRSSLQDLPAPSDAHGLGLHSQSSCLFLWLQGQWQRSVLLGLGKLQESGRYSIGLLPAEEETQPKCPLFVYLATVLSRCRRKWRALARLDQVY